MDFRKYTQLEFRRRFWKLFGASIHITDPKTDTNVGYIEMQAWKLREDVRLYTDETKTHEVLRIHARSIIDFGATYDVIDSATDQALFSLRRKGLRSTFVRDHWDIYDTQDQVIGIVQETSSGLALVRRYVGIVPFVGPVIDLVLSFTPLTFQVRDAQDAVSANLTHRKNPFIVKFGLDTTGATAQMDPRVNVATVALLSVIDAQKN